MQARPTFSREGLGSEHLEEDAAWRRRRQENRLGVSGPIRTDGERNDGRMSPDQLQPYRWRHGRQIGMIRLRGVVAMEMTTCSGMRILQVGVTSCEHHGYCACIGRNRPAGRCARVCRYPQLTEDQREEYGNDSEQFDAAHGDN